MPSRTNFRPKAATAKRLINKNARNVKFVKENDEPSDSAKPWLGNDLASAANTSGGGASKAVPMAFVPASGASLGAEYTTEDGFTRKVDQVGLVASDSLGNINLEEYDFVKDDDRIWRIVFANELKPADVSILWEVGLVR